MDARRVNVKVRVTVRFEDAESIHSAFEFKTEASLEALRLALNTAEKDGK